MAKLACFSLERKIGETYDNRALRFTLDSTRLTRPNGKAARLHKVLQVTLRAVSCGASPMALS